MRLPRHLAMALSGVVLLGGLAGCTVTSDVNVTVRSAASADVQVQVVFTDEAASVLRTDSATKNALVKMFTARAGVAPVVTSGKSSMTFTAPVDYQKLQSSGAITGVSAVKLSGSGHDVSTAVDLRDVPDLVTAISTAVAKQPDAAALVTTMTKSTMVALTVRYPGGVHGHPQVVGVSSQSLTSTATSVTVRRTVAQAASGALVVDGDPTPAPNWPLVVLGVAGVGLAGAIVVARRRDEKAAHSH